VKVILDPFERKGNLAICVAAGTIPAFSKEKSVSLGFCQRMALVEAAA
jgi:hypothetical protein